MIARILILIICETIVIACTNSKGNQQVSTLFADGVFMGPLHNDEINEASGIESSINNPGLLWTHNDSGGLPRVFLINIDGSEAAEFYLKCGWNRDWEDISLGPGPEEGYNYLYIAETGDNKAQHEQVFIYRFKEPTLGQKGIIYDFDRLTFQYPDGKRDAECLMIDPLSGDIYIISKREQHVGIYFAPSPHLVDKVTRLKKVGTLPIHNIVAGDISQDGMELVLKTYDEILYWKRQNLTQPITELLQKPATFLPYVPEPQGEAIAWVNDGSGFYTLSEEPRGVEAGVIYYKRK